MECLMLHGNVIGKGVYAFFLTLHFVRSGQSYWVRVLMSDWLYECHWQMRLTNENSLLLAGTFIHFVQGTPQVFEYSYYLLFLLGDSHQEVYHNFLLSVVKPINTSTKLQSRPGLPIVIKPSSMSPLRASIKKN